MLHYNHGVKRILLSKVKEKAGSFDNISRTKLKKPSPKALKVDALSSQYDEEQAEIEVPDVSDNKGDEIYRKSKTCGHVRRMDNIKAMRIHRLKTVLKFCGDNRQVADNEDSIFVLSVGKRPRTFTPKTLEKSSTRAITK